MVAEQMLWFVVGLVVLLVGGQVLVRGAVGLARSLGVSSLVVGLTVVSFGTSAPELAVSIASALRGVDDVAVANVVGSNVANILLVLGACAAFRAVTIAPRLATIVTPLMVLCSFALLRFTWDYRITRLEAGALIAGLGGYLLLSLLMSRSKPIDDVGAAPQPTRRFALNGILCIAGLAMLVVGSDVMVKAAVRLASAAGVSEIVIGLTIVAVGTSLPEMATSVIAVIRKEPDIAAGNVVGSNIFNILCIVGVTGLVCPLTVSPVLVSRDITVMIAAALILLPMVLTQRTITRAEGVVLLAGYGAYLGWLVAVGG